MTKYLTILLILLSGCSIRLSGMLETEGATNSTSAITRAQTYDANYYPSFFNTLAGAVPHIAQPTPTPKPLTITPLPPAASIIVQP